MLQTLIIPILQNIIPILFYTTKYYSNIILYYKILLKENYQKIYPLK